MRFKKYIMSFILTIFLIIFTISGCSSTEEKYPLYEETPISYIRIYYPDNKYVFFETNKSTQITIKLYYNEILELRKYDLSVELTNGNHPVETTLYYNCIFVFY